MDAGPASSADSPGLSVAASVTDSASALPSPQKTQQTLKDTEIKFQTWAPQKKVLRLGPEPRPACVRWGIMLALLVILLPSLYCDRGSARDSPYEIVTPTMLPVEGRGDPLEEAAYVLSMQGQKQLIRLTVERDYFVSHFPVFSYHSGVLGREMPFSSRDCHYQGYIEGVPGSFVSVNTCSGLRGILIKEGKAYGIEPMEPPKRSQHVLYTLAQQTRVSCSVTSQDSPVASTSASASALASQQQRSRKPHSPHTPSSLWSHTKYVEMFVVVTNQCFQTWGSNVTEAVRRVMDVIALANSFTRGINTQVVLAGMELWTEGDLVEVPEDLAVALGNFNRWRQEELFPRVKHDVAHMIVGHHPGEATGRAFLSGACSREFAAAVESFHHEDALLSAALMVHELGHNLGIEHDHSACICEDQHFCLMHENVTKESGFSNCSSDYYYQFLHGQKGACLFNKPQHKGRRRRDSVCGNGVLESGEQCDCGPDCSNHPCCDSTCQLRTNALCSQGLCCVNCLYRSKGFTCRPASGECDLPEYCDGTSEVCPGNRYKQDGTLCDIVYYCVGGQCRNPNNQCMNIYGNAARSAPEECYTAMNSRGNRFGNCGRPKAADQPYVKCQDDNVFCGKLICTGVRQLPPIKPQHTVIQVPHEEDFCWSMDAYGTTDIPDDGEVHAGTHCAPNKVCVNSTCSEHTVLHYDCEPESMCNGNGICNNLRHCHCDYGYHPPDCKHRGYGGSVDSGPPGKSTTESESTSNVTKNFKSIENIDYVHLAIYIIPALLFVIVYLLCIFLCLRTGVDSADSPVTPSAESSEVTSSSKELLEGSEGEEKERVSKDAPPPGEALPPAEAPQPGEAPPPAESSPPEAPPEAPPQAPEAPLAPVAS